MTTLAVSVGDVAEWAQIVGVALALLALAIAWFQLRKAVAQTTNAAADAKRAVAVAESQAVLLLDLAFSQQAFEQLREKINSSTALSDDDRVPLRRYIAMFERLGLLREKEIVTMPVANHFYGDRLENLLRKCESDVRAIVEYADGAGREGWRDFITLWAQMRDRAEGRGSMPKPPELREKRN